MSLAVSLLASQAPEKLETISARLGFAERGAEKHYLYAFAPPEGVPATNVAIRDHSVTIAHARPISGRLSLDLEG